MFAVPKPITNTMKSTTPISSAREKTNFQKPLFFIVIAVLLATFAAPFWGLFAGLLFSAFLGSPFDNKTLSNIHKPLLQYAVVGLGFGMNISDVISTGTTGFGVTMLTIASTISAGTLMAKLMKVENKQAFLISVGTAVCGGSAIAAVSPVTDAKSREISVALGVVFVLNALALFIFPPLGKFFEMTQTEFAWWSAVAIHDTSSVVGAAAQFGEESLAKATLIKLTRALWIVPITLVSAYFFRSKEKSTPFPVFMLYFVAAAIAGTYVSFIHDFAPAITKISKLAFTLVLFLIGIGINKTAIREAGFRPIMFGFTLWLLVGSISFVGIKFF